jgi:lipoprotein-releasing system permease protein
VALIATASGVLAAIAPARRAAQLDPAQAIRL